MLASLHAVLPECLHEFLAPHRFGEILGLMKPFFHSQGNKICDKGASLTELRVLVSGAAHVRDPKDEDRPPKRLGPFDTMGTEYLDGARTYKCDVLAASDAIEGLAVSWVDLEKLCGQSLLGYITSGARESTPELPSARPTDPFGMSAAKGDFSAISSIFEVGKNTAQIDLADIQVRVLLGYGFAAEVYLVHDNRTEKPAALKVIRKERLTDVKMVEHVINEINILMMVNSPMVCRLFGTYQDGEALYLFMEFISGPEMMMVLETVDRFDYDQASTYFYVYASRSTSNHTRI